MYVVVLYIQILYQLNLKIQFKCRRKTSNIGNYFLIPKYVKDSKEWEFNKNRR